MKTKHMTAEQRQDRRDAILWGREEARAQHKKRGVAFVKSKTTRKVFGRTIRGSVHISHDFGAYQHSSERQRTRYARQIAAGQLRMAGM